MNRFFFTAAVAIAALALIFYFIIRGRSGTMGPEKSTTGKIIQLPDPHQESSTSIEKSLRERRSIRQYRSEPLTMEEIAQLLWAAQGITHGREFRSAPSAGALYPLETYLVAGNVTGLAPGIYRYLPQGHRLAMLLSGDVRRQLCGASLHQDPVLDAPASIVFSAVFSRATGKYGNRGIRYSHMESGIAAQNVSLQAVSLNLGTVLIGAFEDEDVRRVMSMPTGENPMLILPVGKKRGAVSGP
jgi:SagB-type dehydrogenase family enzyme